MRLGDNGEIVDPEGELRETEENDGAEQGE